MENLNETEITPEITKKIWADAKRYATVCHVIEAIWLKREDKDYREIDLENLPWVISPESEKIASFIEDLYIGPIEESGEAGDEVHDEQAWYAVNEHGETMQDFIMKGMLGVNELPEGFQVGFVNGNTLDCRRDNLILVPIDGAKNNAA